MSTTFTCDDKPTLVAYLYGEVDAATRDLVDAHLAGCATCATEIAALGDVRTELSLWGPPDAALGFQIVRNAERQAEQPPAQVLRPAQWWTPVPAWAQAAAAVLVLGIGLGAANLQVSSSAEGFSVTTGWMKPALSEPIDGAAIERRVEGRVEQALVSLEQQLRDEMRTAREQTPVRAAAAPQPADEATLRRVQQLLAASEERQERELALRFTQFVADQNLQRRADIQRISQSVYQSLGQVDSQMLRQRQMMNNMIRASVNAPQ